jgi:hypothetical protein
MTKPIWLYWEGPQPEYISLCCKTVFAHNENVVLLDRASFDRLFQHDRDINIDALALNHKSDFIRAYLLKHYGGLYIDADCIVLRNLSPVLEKASQFGFAGYREPQGHMSCYFMASLADSEVLTEHYNMVCATIRSRRYLEWLDLASVPMEKAIARHPDKSFLFPTEAIMPISWNESERLCIRRSDEEHERYFQHDAFCYMLSNNTIKSRHQTQVLCYMPESHLLIDHYFISFLFRKSLSKELLPLYNVPLHLGGHEDKTQFDQGAFDYLVSHFQVKNMVDIGCGPGGMVYYALSKGIEAVGVDGDPSVARDNPLIIQHDYTKKPLSLDEFDLGWSVEFLEQVEEQYIPNFMETFLCCKHVFITAAIPGQPGYYHVNCQWGDYWIAKFEQAGFELDREATEGVRKHSSMWSRFTEQTGLVFNRKW